MFAHGIKARNRHVAIEADRAGGNAFTAAKACAARKLFSLYFVGTIIELRIWIQKDEQHPQPQLAEDAAINAGIAADPDAHEWTEYDFKKARPAHEVLPALIGARAAGQKGRTEKINITMPRRLLVKIDEYATRHHQTRSGFLAEAARAAMK